MAVKASASITLSFMVDIKATYRYYKLQASTASAPSAPTTYPPSSSSGWNDAEPSYTSGSTNTLYFVDCTVLTNNSFTYSKVSVSSSYEAAKEAFNKAVAAGNTANSANNKIDNLQIGGRNLAESNNIVWFAGVTNTDKSNYVTKGELSFTVTTSSAGFRYDSASDYEPNTEYVLSYYVSKTSGTFSSFAGFHNGKHIIYRDFYIDGVKKSSSGYIYDSVLDDGNRHKIEAHYVTPSAIVADGGVSYTYIQPGRGNSTLPFGIKFEGFKLEKGNRATDWTPAPEDVDSAINAKITSVDVEYYLSTSATSLSGGSWVTTAPTWVNGKYMWSRTKITNGAGKITYSPSQNGTCIAGAKGDTGATGATGTSVSSITEEYYLSTSKTSQTGGSWTTTPPTWSSGKYIWTRSKIVYTNPSSTVYTTPICDSSWEAANDVAKKVEEVADALDASTDVIVGTQTAATGSWTGVAKFSELKDGQRIAYWLPYNGSGNATLNLTLSAGSTTGAKNCYYSGTSRITTQYPAGNVIHLTYRESVSIAGSSTKYTGWWADANYNSDTYDRIKYSSSIKCGSTNIESGRIIVGNNGTYGHLKPDNAFDVTYPILYAGSSITKDNVGTNNYLAIPFKVTPTQNMTLTLYQSVYIKGKLNGNAGEGPLFTPVSTAPLTQHVPTSDDGYQYILLGTAYSATGIHLLNEHPIFQYFDGAFKSVEQIAVEASKVATNYIYHDSTNGLQIGDKSSGSWSGTRSQIKSDAYNLLDQNGTQLASFGATATIGKTSGSNVYIDSDSVDIRNGTTVNASFGASKIELGKNNDAASTRISLLNGYGNIDTTTVNISGVGNYKYLDIYSEKVSISSQTAANNIDGYIPAVIVIPNSASLRARGAYINVTNEGAIGIYTGIGAVSITGNSINFAVDNTSLTKNSNYRIYGGRVIYSNSSGSTGTITLSETAANFSFLEIHYGNSNYQLTTRVYGPNGKKVPLFFDYMVNSKTHQILTKKVTISKTSITTDTSYSGYGNIIDGGTIYVGTENSVKIYYVIGFK